ncbi:group 1 truncated hemoglobin [Glaciimonas immobilis]|nr:group 1 truncated hemoglobin [Glaciimonas immobilis]
MSANLLAQNTPLMPPASVEVYKEFGEKPGLIKLMDDFMIRLVANPVTGPSFAPANQVRIKAELVEQFCQLLSGPCTYQGMSMKTAHASLHINKPQFNALVEELQKSMDAMNIPFRAQNQLLAQLAPMYRDVITVK